MGAELRVEDAQRAADLFAQDHARDLLEERAADARELALSLTRSGHEFVRIHRAYVAMRSDIDSLVAAIPGAVPRTDGPPASHPWEGQLRDLERVVEETPEVEPPLPRWAGLQQRQQQDATHRRIGLLRRKKLTQPEQEELDRLNQGHVIAPAVAMVNPPQAKGRKR
jgi:hypothetical protein